MMRVAMAVTLSIALALTAPAQPSSPYLGFDNNEYPGDQNLARLHQNFAFTGYWLNSPPGTASNSWLGHRRQIEHAGFGFLLLWNGRTESQIKSTMKKSLTPAELGTQDGKRAASAASAEGFPARSILFLDQEEGGRMLPEQLAYIFAWADAVSADGFSPGVYCSGIPFKEDSSTTIVTADDIRAHASTRRIHYFVYNDTCPPAPGCIAKPPDAQQPLQYAEVWQFAQSPRRPRYTAHCATTYSADGNCYAAGFGPSSHLFIDLDSATTADPSHARSAALSSPSPAAAPTTRLKSTP